MVELADASDSKSDGSDTVSVRLRPAAPKSRTLKFKVRDFSFFLLLAKKNPPHDSVERIYYLLFQNFLNDFAHIFKLRFHFASQTNLRAATNKVMIGIFRGEVGVPRKIIRQETHTAFDRH